MARILKTIATLKQYNTRCWYLYRTRTLEGSDEPAFNEGSSEPSLLAYTTYGSRWKLRPQASSPTRYLRMHVSRMTLRKCDHELAQIMIL